MTPLEWAKKVEELAPNGLNPWGIQAVQFAANLASENCSRISMDTYLDGAEVVCIDIKAWGIRRASAQQRNKNALECICANDSRRSARST